MGFTVRAATEKEFDAYVRAIGFGFHQPEISDEELAFWKSGTELDRSVAVFEKGDIVATAGAYSFDMTFPGNRPVPVAGVTAVTVRSTHRRKGLLTKMMRHQLDDVRARGECVATLTASESVIYPRFGYGLATLVARYRINTDRSRFERTIEDKGRLRIVDKDAATKVLPGLHDASRKVTVGDISRNETWWENHFADPKFDRNGGSARYYLVHENAKGKADGYAAYRVKGRWEDDGIPNGEVWVGDVVADDVVANAALWRAMLDVDLTRWVDTWSRPIDDPVRWLLEDPRQLTSKRTADMIWIRLVDVAHALAARGYESEGEIVLDVSDPFCPWNEGRYLLTAHGDGTATCTTTKKKPDVRLGAVELGAAFLGQPCITGLARAGRVEELAKGSVARLDALMRTTVTPYCRTGF